MKKETEDFTDYIDIDWMEVCHDNDLKHGDISPCQNERVNRAIEEINKVLIEFVAQNK